MNIKPFDRGGECFRCHIDEHGKKVFLLLPNPSYSFGTEPALKTPQVPVENCLVCENCLTPEEKIDVVAPVMAAILELMLRVHGHNSNLMPSIAHLRAHFLFRRGVESESLHSTELVDKIIKLLPL